jgi:hypothetical protein
MRLNELYFWEGEKPPPTTIRYEDEDGTLIPISGATMVAKAKIDNESETDITMTNNGDGTATIDWSLVTSDFILPAGRARSTMRIDIEVTDGSEVYFLPRFSVPVLSRS